MPTLFRLCVLSILFLSLATPHRSFADQATLAIQGLSPVGGSDPGQTVTFYAAASGFVNPVYTVSDSFSGSSMSGGSIDKNGYFSWVPTVSDAGTHTLTTIVVDNSGHSATTTVSFLVHANTIVVQSLVPGPVVRVGRSVTFTATAPGFTSPSFSVTDSYPGTSVSSTNLTTTNGSASFAWAPGIGEQGVHTLSLSASDNYGHSASSIKLITVIVPSVSVTSLSPGIASAVGVPTSFQVVANNLATSSTFSMSEVFMGTSTVRATNLGTRGSFLWTPTVSDLGLHTLTLTASDSYGNAASTTQTIAIGPASSISVPTQTASPTASTTSSALSSGTMPTSSKGSGYQFTTSLRIGSRGTSVTELQKRLSALGIYTGPVSGYFGPLTAAAVKQFQTTHHIAALGFVGPATRAALNSN